MIATQRTDGQFVDVRTDTRTVCFRRPTLEAFLAMQNGVMKGSVGQAMLAFALASADNEAAAGELFNEWPGAVGTVAGALAEMVTPAVKSPRKGAK